MITILFTESELEKFAISLKSLVMNEKIQRALSMFQKSKNILYIRADGDGIIGIIKSQTKEELDYSICIDSKRYFCGTQNIRVCGSLRGGICKHILLGLIASVKSGVLDQKKALDLIVSVSKSGPIYDRSKAKSIFEEYEHYKSGTIDWRPIEIFPEDLLAF